MFISSGTSTRCHSPARVTYRTPRNGATNPRMNPIFAFYTPPPGEAPDSPGIGGSHADLARNIPGAGRGRRFAPRSCPIDDGGGWLAVATARDRRARGRAD